MLANQIHSFWAESVTSDLARLSLTQPDSLWLILTHPDSSWLSLTNSESISFWNWVSLSWAESEQFWGESEQSDVSQNPLRWVSRIWGESWYTEMRQCSLTQANFFLLINSPVYSGLFCYILYPSKIFQIQLVECVRGFLVWWEVVDTSEGYVWQKLSK